jgi:hypothetical protein
LRHVECVYTWNWDSVLKVGPNVFWTWNFAKIKRFKKLEETRLKTHALENLKKNRGWWGVMKCPKPSHEVGSLTNEEPQPPITYLHPWLVFQMPLSFATRVLSKDPFEHSRSSQLKDWYLGTICVVKFTRVHQWCPKGGRAFGVP